MTFDEMYQIIAREVYATVEDETNDGRYSAHVQEDSIRCAVWHIMEALEKEAKV